MRNSRNPTFFEIIVVFVCLKFFAELLGKGELEFRMSWLVFLVLASLVYVSLRFLAKKTEVLCEEE